MNRPWGEPLGHGLLYAQGLVRFPAPSLPHPVVGLCLPQAAYSQGFPLYCTLRLSLQLIMEASVTTVLIFNLPAKLLNSDIMLSNSNS